MENAMIYAMTMVFHALRRQYVQRPLEHKTHGFWCLSACSGSNSNELIFHCAIVWNCIIWLIDYIAISYLSQWLHRISWPLWAIHRIPYLVLAHLVKLHTSDKDYMNCRTNEYIEYGHPVNRNIIKFNSTWCWFYCQDYRIMSEKI